MAAQSSGDRWVGLIPLAVGILGLLGAQLWWTKIVAFNRRVFFSRQTGPVRPSEVFNRWLGTVVWAGFGLAFIVSGLVWLVGNHP